MSIAAEFAAEIHKKFNGGVHYEAQPCQYPSRLDKLTEIKAVIVDVYGTLVNYYNPQFAHENAKDIALLEGFKKVCDYFHLNEILEKMNSADKPEATLRDFYHGLIALNHDKSRDKGVSFPEVKIEEIWKIIIMMLNRHGYTTDDLKLGEIDDVAKCMAFYYNFHALGRGFFDGVVDAIQKMSESNIKVGVVSNGQFYTPIDLTLFARDQSSDEIDDYLDIFDPELTFFSFEYNCARPGRRLFEKLFDSLQENQILPEQTVYIGNDLSLDVQEPQAIGLKTALFTGNRNSTFLHDLSDEVIPDISFTSWHELSEKISFYK